MTVMATRDGSRGASGLVRPGVCEAEKTGPGGRESPSAEPSRESRGAVRDERRERWQGEGKWPKPMRRQKGGKVKPPRMIGRLISFVGSSHVFAELYANGRYYGTRRGSKQAHHAARRPQKWSKVLG